MRRFLTPGWFAAPLSILGIALLMVPAAEAVPTAGQQGVDTSLPATPSAVTVQGRGPYAGLSITVNQTASLTNQAVSITWTGGTPTVAGPGRFGAQYLQIMQCWGDDDGTVSGNPGPPPEQCVQGAVAGTYGGLPGGLYPSGFALSRVISRSDWGNFDPAVGVLDSRTTNVWLPFRSVTGEKVDIQTDPMFNPSVQGGNFWLNPFYNIITTNEIAGASTGLDGKGAELFEVHTGVQSSGLGCGQKVQVLTDGSKKVPQCWIVIVPRGSAIDENAGTPFAESAEQFGVATSPLAPSAWQHRIAIPLSFNPVDSPCDLADEERRLSGGELALAAVASWQPLLCTGGTLPPYSYAPVSDAAARQQLTSGAEGAPGMVVVQRPIDATVLDPSNPVVYAPITVSGLTIGFNIERNPRTDAPADEQQLAGVRVAEMNLTPRLLAKLLTQSYTGAVDIQGPAGYPWAKANPAHMGLDPDFLRFNPEFELLQIADTRTFASLQLPAGNSDAALQVWEYVLADPEAAAWLAGAADEWGMKVNPQYATKADANPTGIPFGAPLPSTFPKSDPYCYQGPARGVGGAVVPPLLCGTDWMPYTRGLADGARIARAAADGARIVDNPFAQAASEVWSRELPQFLGRRGMLALTDTPSAAQYGLQMARLSRAGDNGATRSFVAPDTAGLTAGAASMKAKSESAVLEPAPTSQAAGAYPLTAVTYAAIQPLRLDKAARADYAAFVNYAVGPGQVAGLELGQLPRGYAPLPEALAAKSAAAAGAIVNMVAPPTTTTTTTVESQPTFGGGGGGGGGFGGGGDVEQPFDTLPPDTTPTATTVADETSTTVQTGEEPEDTTPSVLTPVLDLTRSRYAVPGLGALALASALGVLEITKRPRRMPTSGPNADADAMEAA
ncbi:MAG: hypothetical protein RL238_167 [Actinomycetota bacterium]